MASTTLTAFLLQVHPLVRTVELLGSWDNFSRPYALERDNRAGRGHWRGCHLFKNITCDGDDGATLESRDGGLKMGGTYWYFYRLDGELEYHDPLKPSTTDCRLLPGQRVNLLEIPIQIRSGSDASSGSLGSAVFTMDPQDKYRTPNPSPYQATADTCHPTSSRVSLATLSSCFSKLLRRTKPLDEKEPKPASRRCKSSDSLSLRSPLSAGVGRTRAVHSAGEGLHPVCNQRSVDFAQSPSHPISEVPRNIEKATKDTRMSSDLSSCQPLELVAVEPSTVAVRSSGLDVPPNTPNALADKVKRFMTSNKHDGNTAAGSVYDEASEVYLTDQQESDKFTPLDARGPPRHESDSARSSSVLASDLCSLSFGPGTSRTGSSSLRFSQPGSPTTCEFGKELSWNYEDPPGHPSPHMNSIFEVQDVPGNGPYLPCTNRGIPTTQLQPSETTSTSQSLALYASQTYSLPEAAHGSTLTLKPPSSETFDPPGFRAPFHKNESRTRVETWNDGSGHRMTDLGELIDDLGYLCEIIN